MNHQVKLYGPFRQILTMAGLPSKGPLKDSQLQVIENGGIRLREGRIIEVGEYSSIKQKDDTLCRVGEKTVALPGFIDVHTHMCWAGNRAHDYALRLQGATYQEIGAKGGGILDTVRHTRAATPEELSAGLKQRVLQHLRRGVTTAEVKSGYGLSVKDEIKMLEAIREVDKEVPCTLIPTCLAAHKRPPEFNNNKEYLSLLKEKLLPKILKKNLCRRVDIFIEEGAFSLEESEQYLSFAKELGFTICAHVDQFNAGGSEAAANVRALSADHLEMTTERESAMLREAGVIPVVLPGATLGLGMPFAPARMLLDDGLPLVIASDWNPGSAPQGDLLVQASLLGAAEKLTMAETLAGLTSRAGKALELDDRGVLKQGKVGNFITFPTDNYQDILYHQGDMPPKQVVIRGEITYTSEI